MKNKWLLGLFLVCTSMWAKDTGKKDSRNAREQLLIKPTEDPEKILDDAMYKETRALRGKILAGSQANLPSGQAKQEHSSTKEETIHFLDSLIQMIDEKDTMHETPEGRLRLAIWHCDAKAVTDLIAEGVDVCSKSLRFNPLEEAVRHEGVEVVKVLIQAGVDVNPTCSPGGMSLLELAIWTDNIKLLQALLEGGADANAVTQQYIDRHFRYSSQDQKEKVEALLSKAGRRGEDAFEALVKDYLDKHRR